MSGTKLALVVSGHPNRWPFAIHTTMGGIEQPALILGWVKGRKGDPDGWHAPIVIASQVEGGEAITMLVPASDIRPAGRR